jgi:hypothetical protein
VVLCAGDFMPCPQWAVFSFLPPLSLRCIGHRIGT